MSFKKKNWNIKVYIGELWSMLTIIICFNSYWKKIVLFNNIFCNRLKHNKLNEKDYLTEEVSK